MLESTNKDISFRKSVYNYGAFIWCSIKTPHFYTDLDLQNTVLNPLANGKIQGLFKTFECFLSTFQGLWVFFSSTFQGKFYFQGLFKTVLYIQVLFKPVRTLKQCKKS